MNDATEAPPSITYREGVTDDAPEIVAFQQAMALETEQLELDREICRSGVEAVFQDPALGRYFVAVSGTHVVASLMITYEWSDWRNGNVWWIQSVYVRPEYRRQRIYAGLYSFIRQRVVLDERIRGIRLYVDRRNVGAQQVYQRLGMNGEHYQLFEWMKQ